MLRPALLSGFPSHLAGATLFNPFAAAPGQYRADDSLTLLNGSRGPVFRFDAPPAFQSPKPLLLLHEYPNLSLETMALAARLSKRGFTVYVPTLLGKPLVRPLIDYSGLQMVTSSDWKVAFQKHETSPIVVPLRTMVRRLSEQYPGQDIKIIGMGLTASLPLALASEPAVHQIVVAQPAAPFFAYTQSAKRALGISDADWQHAQRKASQGGLKVMGLRFEGDTTSKAERFATLKEGLGTAFRPVVIPLSSYAEYHIERNAHPVLTYCINRADQRADNPIIRTYETVVAFLGGSTF